MFKNCIKLFNSMKSGSVFKSAFVKVLIKQNRHQQLTKFLQKLLCSQRAKRVANEVSSTVENMIKEK